MPILTALAIAGRLGPDGWRLVPQLPFELAACPARWFKWMRLPVVSYALPALIAIGQARHRARPTRNPLTRAARGLAGARTLRVLRGIQPSSGGYLEATPLTSFVVMSLAAAGFPAHPVAREGIAFLTRAVRGDGSWPIDTNLATWVTTMAVDALGGLESKGPEAAASERVGESEGRSPSIKVIEWLLAQQYQREHPYTQAAPGGWAWTDLPGGVPDADDTAGALVALRTLAPRDPRALEAAAAGVRWLLDLQNGDGGMPTFCRGWGALPFDRSGADLTAHAVCAWLAWRDDVPELHQRIEVALDRAARYLAREQRPDGAWAPLWFGNAAAPGHVNFTYGTSKVVMAMARLAARHTEGAAATLQRGAAWLIAAQREDGGWGGALDAPAATIEETALAVAALAAAGPSGERHAAITRGVEWLRSATDGGRVYPAAPIGLYFASLWYSEDLYPVIFTVAALEAAAGGGA
ncbi:MAG: prenyltransferase/squalene oxidase repeat-containing protein [Vicinamibacterales bacterium]